MTRRAPAPPVCPTCRQPLPPSLHPGGRPSERWPFFPFCSERCRLLDLGAWLSGRYVIPGPPVDPEQLPEHPDRERGSEG